MSTISDNLRLVREKIASAAGIAGRDANEITLVAVTKTRSVDDIREAVSCGVTDIGENYVQEAQEKYGELGKIARWHMIGHLQRNKVRHVVEFADMIHSVDSAELAVEIGRRAEAASKRVDVLIEAKVSDEATKFGAEPEVVLGLADKISKVSGIRLCGFMGMAPFAPDPEDARPYFAKLKLLWDKLPDEQQLFLSMGMTHDFEIAIEEGANMVRIGTAIFGPRG